MIIGLTTKQSAVLDFIRSYIATEGASPSFDDIREAMGLASKSGVHRLVTALVERGHITIKYGLPRSIRLVSDRSVTAVLNPDTLKRLKAHAADYGETPEIMAARIIEVWANEKRRTL